MSKFKPQLIIVAIVVVVIVLINAVIKPMLPANLQAYL